MSDSTVISVDAMGGDDGPKPVVAGLARAIDREPDLRFLVFGDGERIEPELNRRKNARVRDAITLRHTDDVVRMSDDPSRAWRERRGSSMWAALQSVKAGEARVAVSCGNTGALLTLATLILRKAPSIHRSALAVHWPSAQGHGFNTVLDVGAEKRAGPRALAQYAVMGAEYARLSFGLERPRVGILNIGTEPGKGLSDHQIAAARLARVDPERAGFEPVGFVEGTDIPETEVDVIVTDGFTGNVALKTAEGTASFIRTGLKEAFQHTVLSKLSSLLAYTSLKRFQKRIDPRRVNGGVFLGLNGTVVKSHGSADAVGVASAVRLAAALATHDLTGTIGQRLAALDFSDLPTMSQQEERVSSVEAVPDAGRADAPADRAVLEPGEG
ncbi:MAG: phosphate acyltransferase PlsX [Paracoccaceae bacterium]